MKLFYLQINSSNIPQIFTININPVTAKWISTEKVGKTVPPYLRKTFSIPNSKNVKEARVYVTGFGLYELYINASFHSTTTTNFGSSTKRLMSLNRYNQITTQLA